MNTRSKVVELGGARFEVRRLPPEVGSFIFMRMMGASMRMESPVENGEKQAEDPGKPKIEVTGEMRVRALTFAVFSGNISFDDFKFIQDACMRVVSKMEVNAGQEFPMPIMADNGRWTQNGQEVYESVGLVTQLTAEVLVFCFSDFFNGSSPA